MVRQLGDECRKQRTRGYSKLRKEQLQAPSNGKTPLKWVGGKTQLLPKLMTHIEPQLSQADNYCEPFVGGGSVLLAVLSSGFRGNVVVNDANSQLINFYRHVQSEPVQLANLINRVVEYYNDNREQQESYYYQVRDVYNEEIDAHTLDQAVRFYFLNRAGFRGLYRVGRRGFNVPFGRYKRLSLVNFLELSRQIQSVRFYNMDYLEFYEQVIDKLPGKSLIYYDPPYVPVNETSFTSYTASSFDHQRFLQHVGEASRLMKVVMSNSNTNIVRNFATEFDIAVHEVECRRQIRSDNPGLYTTEIIATAV